MYGVGNNIIIYKVTICIRICVTHCVKMQTVIRRGWYKPTEIHDNIILLHLK